MFITKTRRKQGNVIVIDSNYSRRRLYRRGKIISESVLILDTNTNKKQNQYYQIRLTVLTIITALLHFTSNN